jgi:hypothetical protein
VDKLASGLNMGAAPRTDVKTVLATSLPDPTPHPIREVASPAPTRRDGDRLSYETDQEKRMWCGTAATTAGILNDLHQFDLAALTWTDLSDDAPVRGERKG